jgi:superfamily II DNA helicase RecQ
MLPDQWPLVVLEPTKDQFKTVKNSFRAAMSNKWFAPWMRDVLLVMPTGASKSLCCQLPGLARVGTTLVGSPLIVLMDDQVPKLQSLGLRAERIHSGRSRPDSRPVRLRYLAGELDFLFIAPERLGVPERDRAGASGRAGLPGISCGGDECLDGVLLHSG